MKFFKNKSKKIKLAGIIFPAFLVFITLFLIQKNFSPGTFLTGWDALHPEFNFSLYLKRAFSGVWRADQGLGNIASHAHMADLPRVIILWISSTVFPLNLLRYFYAFLTLILGPLGVYCFSVYVFGRKNIWSRVGAFLASSYYLLNLGTLQFFFIPFEMFLTQYALLPWLFLFVFKIIKKGGRKNYLVFAILSLLATPMAYAPTLFYAYLIGLFAFIFSLIVISKNKIKGTKKSFFIFVFIFLINAFWMFPNFYSVINQSTTIEKAKINILFSPEARLRNQDYGGSLGNIVTHKGFMFSWRGFDFEDEEFNDLFDVWKNHLNSKTVEWVGYVLAGIFVLGVFLSLISRDKVGLALLIPLVISVFFLVNNNSPFDKVYSYLIERFSLFREAYRMPYTKFSILFMFICSYYFGYTFKYLLSKFDSTKIVQISKIVPALFIFGLLVFYSLPVIKGNLIGEKQRIEISQEYFQTFEWFKKNNGGRVARFPLNNLYNWEFHDWGYEGSGWFLWFGIENPILDRDFDRWSPYNESFYREASYSLYKKDVEQFEKILEKYQVKYLLLDESIINAGGQSDVLYTNETKTLLNASSKVRKAQEFGFLTVYETSFDVGEKSIWSPETYKQVDIDLTYSQEDNTFSSQTAYIQNKEGTTYPFANLDKRMGVEVKFEGDGFILNSNELIYPNTKALNSPKELNATINKATKKVEVNIKTEEKISENLTLNGGFDDATNCDLKKEGSVTRERFEGGVKYEAFDGGVSCDYYFYPQMERSKGYILRVKGENKKGRGLKIYLFNPETKKMDLEELLPEGKFDEYFFILPNNIVSNSEEKEIETGYTLNVETRSFGRVSSENIIQKIEIVEYPHSLISQIKLEPEHSKTYPSNLKIEEVKKTGTTNYRVNVSGEGLLVLGQGYEEGWIATINGKKLEHKKVNSWQNGWIVPEGENEITITFWPQYLEWGGLILLLLIPVILIYIDNKQVSRLQ